MKVSLRLSAFVVSITAQLSDSIQRCASVIIDFESLNYLSFESSENCCLSSRGTREGMLRFKEFLKRVNRFECDDPPLSDRTYVCAHALRSVQTV